MGMKHTVATNKIELFHWKLFSRPVTLNATEIKSDFLKKSIKIRDWTGNMKSKPLELKWLKCWQWIWLLQVVRTGKPVRVSFENELETDHTANIIYLPGPTEKGKSYSNGEPKMSETSKKRRPSRCNCKSPEKLSSLLFFQRNKTFQMCKFEIEIFWRLARKAAAKPWERMEWDVDRNPDNSKYPRWRRGGIVVT